jgi:hypothetical protein
MCRRIRKVGADVQLTLRWLEATSFLRNLKRSFFAARAFAKVFAQGSPDRLAVLMSDMQVVNREALRLARVRLDVASMLLHRRLCESLGGVAGQGVAYYLYTDASPQWRGSELCASSLDMVDHVSQAYSRRLLPIVSLDKGFFDSLGKTLALLWQLWLCCGPSFEAMRRCCSQVRSVTSDLGTERFIVNMGDILPFFYQVIGFPMPRSDLQASPATQHLFPMALQVPGWRHAVDVLLQRALSALPWFPRWVAQFKALSLAALRWQWHSSVFVALNL